MHPLLLPAGSESVPLWPLARGQEGAALPPEARAWITASGFEVSAGKVLAVPGSDGNLLGAVFGVDAADAEESDPFTAANLARDLPAGSYRFEGALPDAEGAVLGFLLGTYRFTRYRASEGREIKLVLPEGVDGEKVSRIAEGVFLARDLVNTPSNDMGPDELEEAARALAHRHGADVAHTVTGEDLARDFPLIHAVGVSSPRAPRLIDFTWGRKDAPKVTLVGKGVCFDTGGLDIKPSSSMLLMKKDMGGAANVLGLAHMIMAAGLKLRLRVLIPAVENAVSGRAFRPGDVLSSRKGLTVEVGNTDAEGRLVLADALTLADAEEPELLIDMATLTGAARVALGPDLPPMFTDDDVFAEAVARCGMGVRDPVWRLPLWRPYAKMLDSKIADMNNVSGGGHAGAITAALFLRRFVEKARAYAHFDIFAWNPSSRPGRPEGGEAHAIRALFAHLSERYS